MGEKASPERQATFKMLLQTHTHTPLSKRLRSSTVAVAKLITFASVPRLGYCYGLPGPGKACAVTEAFKNES